VALIIDELAGEFIGAALEDYLGSGDVPEEQKMIEEGVNPVLVGATTAGISPTVIRLINNSGTPKHKAMLEVLGAESHETILGALERNKIDKLKDIEDVLRFSDVAATDPDQAGKLIASHIKSDSRIDIGDYIKKVYGDVLPEKKGDFSKAVNRVQQQLLEGRRPSPATGAEIVKRIQSPPDPRYREIEAALDSVKPGSRTGDAVIDSRIRNRTAPDFRGVEDALNKPNAREEILKRVQQKIDAELGVPEFDPIRQVPEISEAPKRVRTDYTKLDDLIGEYKPSERSRVFSEPRAVSGEPSVKLSSEGVSRPVQPQRPIDPPGGTKESRKELARQIQKENKAKAKAVKASKKTKDAAKAGKGFFSRAAEWVKKNPKKAGAGALAALLGSMWLTGEDREEIEEAPVEKKPEQINFRRPAPAKEERGRLQDEIDAMRKLYEEVGKLGR